jgi:hypothetical protein
MQGAWFAAVTIGAGWAEKSWILALFSQFDPRHLIAMMDL